MRAATSLRSRRPITRRYPLASRVLAVARTRVECAWAVYVDAVPGCNHEDEQEAVLRDGAKVNADVACAMFPELARVPYAR